VDDEDVGDDEDAVFGWFNCVDDVDDDDATAAALSLLSATFSWASASASLLITAPSLLLPLLFTAGIPDDKTTEV